MKRNAFTMFELLIVMLIVAVLIALIVPAVLKVREAQAQNQTVHNLKELTLACHRCNDLYRKLPPATGDFGDPAVTGTVHIHLLPFLEQDQLYREIAAGIASDLNAVVVEPFISPQDFTQISEGAGVANFAANLRVFSDLGFKTQWHRTIAPDAHGNDHETGKPWYFGTAAIPRSFPDGTSNTIAFTTQYSKCGAEGDLNYFTNSAGMPARSPFFGFYAPDLVTLQLLPGVNEGISDERHGESFQVMPTVEDCNPSYTPQSFSRTTISVSLFDGSVPAVSTSISRRTWTLAIQPNDGQPLVQDYCR